jgi:hypothetical protein
MVTRFNDVCLYLKCELSTPLENVRTGIKGVEAAPEISAILILYEIDP